MAKQKFTFHENCVFLDEVGFDVYMRRSRGWAQRSKPAIEETTSARSVSHTVISAVSPFGIVNRKAPEDAVAAIPKGTTAGHFVQFISDTLDIIDEFPNVKGFHMVMDNAPIHSRDVVDPIILERGLCTMLEDRVRREKLKDTETLSSRVIDAPIEHMQNFI
ncbi:hypothetical protein G6F56_006596 [Rhizopus delemar]|nr:hypothetical protein G6F56_006596 [Rhizopus delemar]